MGHVASDLRELSRRMDAEKRAIVESAALDALDNLIHSMAGKPDHELRRIAMRHRDDARTALRNALDECGAVRDDDCSDIDVEF